MRTFSQRQYAKRISKSIAIAVCVLLSFSTVAASKPDLVILNAKIYTGKSKKVRNGGIAIRDGQIIRVDRTYKIRNMMGRETKRVDARNRLVVPGFNDSHTHFAGIGNLFSSIDLRSISNRSEITAKVKEYVRYLPKGRWILGGNWDNTKWNSKELPDRSLLDDVSPENPVFIYGSSPDIALVNTAALTKSRITRFTTSPQNGEIVKGANGEPNGVLKGTAILLVRGNVPTYASKQMGQVLQTASNYAASLGVTSVQDMHSDYLGNELRKLEAARTLKTRVYDCTPLFDWKKLAAKQMKAATGSGFVREGCLKTLSFRDKDAAEELYKEILGADAAGMQVMVHAIGSAANKNILDIFERVIAKNGRRDRRFRSEHAARFSDSDLRRFGKLGIIASMQPHLFGGYEPYRSLLRSKARVSFGSDASITDFNPLVGIHAAVNRNTSKERLAVHEAVNLYTIGSAYAEFQEKVKGTIEKGKVADLVILSDNIFKIEKNKIRNTSVEMTIVGGKIVYDRRVD